MKQKEFNLHKKNLLNKKDKSNIGEIDKQVLNLINLINKNKDYVTSSSCSGRIILVIREEKKNKTRLLLKSHEYINLEEIEAVVEKNNDKNMWFIQEGLILHIHTRTLKKAEELREKAKKAGFKKAYFLSVKEKIIVEIKSNEKIETPLFIKENNINKEFLKILVREANKKLEKNFKQIEKFEKELSGNL